MMEKFAPRLLVFAPGIRKYGKVEKIAAWDWIWEKYGKMTWNPNDPFFWLEKGLFLGVDLQQNRGQKGAPGDLENTP